MQIDTSHKSVNFSSRGVDKSIQMIVIHSTEGTRSSDIPILTGQTYRKVSVHYYITRDGHIYQFVPDVSAAWHAGVSSWLGHNSDWIQDHSIGIELENTNIPLAPHRQDYPEAQVSALVELTQSLIQKYGVKPEYLVRHSDIAPVRKPDPVSFDWVGFRTRVLRSGQKPQTLVPEPNPSETPAPDTPYQTADWLNPQQEIKDEINTAAETAVSNVFAGLGEKFKAWLTSLFDSLRG